MRVGPIGVTPMKEKPVALVTGANTGIGRVTARELARRGYRLVLACRSLERSRTVIDEITAISTDTPALWLPLDLADLDSVRECATRVLDTGLPLQLLVNNAGVAGVRGLTPAGFEMMFGINHIGPFLLTNLLLERLKASKPARIVTVASRAHRRCAGLDLEAARRPTASRTGIREYGMSKLANILFSAELARKLDGAGVTTYSLHPGVVDTDIMRGLPWVLRRLNRLRTIGVEEGAKTTLYCATASEVAAQSGRYYADCAVAEPDPMADDAGEAARLWQWSRAMLAREGHGV